MIGDTESTFLQLKDRLDVDDLTCAILVLANEISDQTRGDLMIQDLILGLKSLINENTLNISGEIMNSDG